jgi:hypothetical protein
MLLPVLALLAVLVIGFLVFVSTRPSTFRYTRKLAIAAPAAELFDQINDLRKFQDWNPWAKKDPQCQVIFSGPPSGVGCSYEWKGNKDVGEGTMTIIESQAPGLMRARLEFRKPFAATNTAEFTFTPEGGQILVTWSMSGDCNFLSKLFNVIIDCDKMVGKDFEQGLANLKALAERRN